MVGTRSSKTSKFAKEDDLSRMPPDVLTNVMDRLPIRDAVRTGILSRAWRFKWTTMRSQLVFDEQFFKDLLGTQGTKSSRNVINFLLHLKGSITKFTLDLPMDMTFDVKDINRWFMFLSGKGINHLTLKNYYDNAPLKLPAKFFSCSQLTRLKLDHCCFDPPASFRGFPNLLSLELYRVQFEKYQFGELITQCPLLEILHILILGCQVKQVDIAKLENLKVLTMPINDLDTRPLTSSRIIQLVGSFPKLQELNLNLDMYTFLEKDGNEIDVLATFPCLKTLKIRFIDLASDIMASFVLKMIRCSPNLQTLKILVDFYDDVPHHALSSSDLDCNTMGMLQLRSVVFSCPECSENEVYLIKFLLACSPLLKKIAIRLYENIMVDKRLKFAEKLLKLHRASPIAEIDFSYFSESDVSSLWFLLGIL